MTKKPLRQSWDDYCYDSEPVSTRTCLFHVAGAGLLSLECFRDTKKAKSNEVLPINHPLPCSGVACDGKDFFPLPFYGSFHLESFFSSWRWSAFYSNLSFRKLRGFSFLPDGIRDDLCDVAAMWKLKFHSNKTANQCLEASRDTSFHAGCNGVSALQLPGKNKQTQKHPSAICEKIKSWYSSECKNNSFS